MLEDDLLFGESLTDLLEDASYEVVYCPNGQDALDATFAERFDLYLLDINVPLLNGISLLSELRGAEDTTPAIFLTSHREKSMLEKGFLSGCDDYLKKPFDNEELLFRIEAILKRTQKIQSQSIGFLSHDALHKQIFYQDKALELSKKEYELLLLLMQHADATVPKELIIEKLWSVSEGGSTGAIRVYINRLKQLLPEMRIENIRGVGYKLVS